LFIDSYSRTILITFTPGPHFDTVRKGRRRLCEREGGGAKCKPKFGKYNKANRRQTAN